MTVLKWLAIWVILAISTALVLGRECVRYYELTKEGTPTIGHVTDKLSHYRIQYDFDVDGQQIRGIGRGDTGDPSYSNLTVGDEVTVHYVRSSPNINCLGDPSRHFRSELLLVLFAMLTFPTFVTAVFARRISKISSAL